MRFNFNEDHLAFQTSVRDFLTAQCTPEMHRSLWEDATGRSTALWKGLADMGLLGALIDEEHGGLSMSAVDIILLLEETGRVALAEPLVETAVVAAPLLAEVAPDLAAQWLPRVVAGDAVLTVGNGVDPFVADAHVADLLLLPNGNELHAVSRDSTTLVRQPSNDPARRLFAVQWTPSAATCVASGASARRAMDAAFDRAALALAAQLVGISQRLVELSVEYAGEREQFGKPIGTFQALKHHLANVQVRLEFVKPVLYRAAHSVATSDPQTGLHVAHAKAAAGDAAALAAKTALQVHGAIGYTWEVSLHIWMKRAWALQAAWGTSVWHRARLARVLLDGGDPAPSFGYQHSA